MSMKVVENPNYIEVSNIVAYEYIEFFEKMGFTVILVPNNSAKLLNYFDIPNIDAVVLIGGNNVDPVLYGGDELPDVYSDREKAEDLLIDESVKRDIPLIGICRGFQKINVHFGGSISHGIKDHVRKDHELISVNSILSGVVTNTFHNQGITNLNLSKDLTVIAHTADGYIEAVKHKKYPILGVQWHPEREDKDFDIKLIQEFLEGEV